jgi:glutathione S-transferase
MKLMMTPRSHFARKVRILMRALDVPHELVDVGNIVALQTSRVNPAAKVPALLHGSTTVLESDTIAGYVVRRTQNDDRFGVFTMDVELLNARAVMNAAMSAEVELVLGGRAGLPAENQRFDKLRKVVHASFEWLEEHAAALDTERPSYASFHLVCLHDYTKLHKFVQLSQFPKLSESARRTSLLPYVAESIPPPL